MTPEEKQNKKSQHATNEQTRWTKKRDKMTPEELQNKESKHATNEQEEYDS